MWINIRTMDGKNSARIDDLSKITKIEDLRIRVEDALGTPPNLQRLIFNGKQLEDGYTLYDYDVGLNSIIQLVVRPIEALMDKQNGGEASSGDESSASVASSSKENKPEAANAAVLAEVEIDKDSLESRYYKAGDLVDAVDKIQGCWFEAVIVKIEKDTDKKNPDGFLYHIKFEDIHDGKTFTLSLLYIRPRASTLIPFEEVEVGSTVMVNYNPLEPDCKGYWFDLLVKEKEVSRQGKKSLRGTIYVGRTANSNCTVKAVDHIYQIPIHRPLVHRDAASETVPLRRMVRPNCNHCNDKMGVRCHYCACHVCGGQESPDQQIMCDECDMAFHLWCLKPPLESVPEEDEWFCPECRNDRSEVVHAGEKLKASKRKAKMASAQGECKRDWGKGMACVGRTKVCTIVPTDHLGPIPGIEVGMLWKYRVQVSEAGVHRPHVAGIHGTEKKGAYSIVLSGGYEDDKDDGDEFIYTGSGGRDLSGNKRTAEQSCDQTLTRMNKALAINCAAQLNNKEGATAKDWKKGRPVRVIRNCKGRKHSAYAPEEGNRYDGIYKIVKYWPEKGESGFLVWRYLLRRDDPTPAPWTDDGKRIIEEKGFQMVYPDGYVPPEVKEKQNKKGKKRASSEGEESEDEQPTKKTKVVEYKIPAEAEQQIQKDLKNQALWEECCQIATVEGAPAFLKKVEETFMCICCQEVAWRPVTTACGHNICFECLQRSFKAEVFTCPMCRHKLSPKSLAVNDKLAAALEALFPGYGAGR